MTTGTRFYRPDGTEIEPGTVFADTEFVPVNTYLSDCVSHWWHGTAFGLVAGVAACIGVALAKGWL